jgi:parallel beta-helix repeat protein
LIQSLLVASSWLALLVMIIHPARASLASATLTVCSSGCGFSTIQLAINAASPNDVIKVAAGTYAEHIVIAKSIALIGGWNNPPAFVTRTLGASIIDGSNTGRVVLITGTASITPLIDGFTIQHGNAASAAIDVGKGSGVYINRAQATLQNNSIISNSSNGANSFGGGISILGSTAVVSNNLIAANTVTATLESSSGGAGIYVLYASPFIYSNTIQDNTAYGNGGGIYVVNNTVPESPTIQKNLIQGNRSLPSSLSNGGGVHVIAVGGLSVVDANRLYNNTSENGVLVIDVAGNYRVTNNILAHNSAGGVHVYNSNSGAIANNLILYTQGQYGAIRLTPYGNFAYVFNNMIMSNTYGLEVEFGSHSVRSNNLVYKNVLTNYVAVSGSQYSNMPGSPGDLNVDPQFVNVSTGDYHLKNGSPAINAGGYYPGAPQRDFGGKPRPFSSPTIPDCRMDIGIYESDQISPCRRVFLPLMRKNS